MPALPSAANGAAPSRVCLGTAPFGVTTTEAVDFYLLDRYVAAGGNFIDTARIYSDWIPGEKRRSERIIGDWLSARGDRDQLIIATKGAHPFIETLTTPRSSAAEIRATSKAGCARCAWKPSISIGRTATIPRVRSNTSSI